MSEGYVGQRRNGVTLTIVIAGHVAVIAALALVKMEFGRLPDKPIDTWNIPVDPLPPPPEPPIERKTEPRPAQSASSVTVIKPPMPTPSKGPIVTQTPVDDFTPTPGPVGPVTVIPTPEPLPIVPPTPEPVPAPKPTKLKPRGNPAAWVTNDDYPATALRAEEQGRTSFRLDVGADGKPTACAVTGSSGSRTLDEAACRLLMRRARFVPGTGADGSPAGGTYANSFSWQIPED